MIGQTLKERYHIYDRLGTGGAATVYLGRDSDTGLMVVIKVVHAHLVNDKFMGRFQREIDLLRQIDNPYVVKLYDWALREYEPEMKQTLSYIVAEFIEGHTLADIIDTRGALNEPDALAIARQVALGLDSIHRQGIIHRDIKSQNIMITPENEAKLIDFGIAKGQDTAALTGSSQFAGTLYYASPEQILESHTVDQRTDIYALGVVLYEMLTATLPVKAREIGTVASKVIAGDLDPITGVSQPVEALVNNMIALRIGDRIPTAMGVVKRIEEISGGAREPVLADINLPQTTTSMHPMDLSGVPAPRAPLPMGFLVTESGMAIPLDGTEMIVGRSHPRDTAVPDVDLWVLGLENARTASRRHCRVFREEGTFYVEDLGSMNGTRLNEAALDAGVPTRLNSGDRIEVGQVVLIFQNTQP